MRLLKRLRQKSRHHQEEGPWQRFFRIVIITLLFCAVVLGFWMNSERQMNKLRKPSINRIDSTDTLTEEQLQALAEYMEHFQQAYGISMRIAIRDELFIERNSEIPEEKNVFFLGLYPSGRQVILHLPPLVAAALGEASIIYLRYSHFLPYFAEGKWPQGLASALSIIVRRLDVALAMRSS